MAAHYMAEPAVMVKLCPLNGLSTKHTILNQYRFVSILQFQYLYSKLVNLGGSVQVASHRNYSIDHLRMMTAILFLQMIENTTEL